MWPGRVKAPAGTAHPWEARPPFHADLGDGRTTRCKKRLATIHEEETKSRLLEWCRSGLEIGVGPAEYPRSTHKDTNPKDFPLKPFAQSLADLRDALTAIPPPPALA